MDALAFSIPAADGSQPVEVVSLFIEVTSRDRKPWCADTGYPSSLALLEAPHGECLVGVLADCDGDGD